MENNPLISVVTVCYNAAAVLEETMLSVLNQTYPNVEYIVIDGGSTDGTVDIIKKYAHRLAYWVSEPDKGIYDAMNKAIVAATGQYINFMNAGDKFYDENAISEVVSQLDPESDIVYGDNISILKNSRYRKISCEVGGLAKGMPFCHQSVFVRTAYHKLHPFCTKFKAAGDYNFFYNALFVNSVKFQYIPIVVSVYDGREGMSKDNYWLTYKEYLTIRNESDTICKRIRASYILLKRQIKQRLPLWAITIMNRINTKIK